MFNELSEHPEITSLIKNIPVVIANGKVELPDFYSVLVDDVKGIRRAAEYLYDGGRRDLVYVIDKDTDSARRKMAGFLEAMKLRDGPDGPERVIRVPESSLEGGFAAVCQIFEKGLSVNGIVCGQDITAVGVIKALKQRGLRVPEDVAVTGCDNSPYSRICEPELASLDNKPELLGRMCARILAARLEQEDGEEAETETGAAIQPELIVRESARL